MNFMSIVSCNKSRIGHEISQEFYEWNLGNSDADDIKRAYINKSKSIEKLHKPSFV